MKLVQVYVEVKRSIVQRSVSYLRGSKARVFPTANDDDVSSAVSQ